MFDLPEIEGIGPEVLGLFAGVVLVGLLYLAWKSTGIAPLNYDLFLVEIQTYHQTRIVQVLHIGYEEVRQVGGDLIRRLRELTQRQRQGQTSSTTSVVSDTNVVIQSPATVVEGETSAPEPSGDMRLWELEIPISTENSGNARDLSDSELAAAAAVAVVSGRMRVSTTDREINMERITELNLDSSSPATEVMVPESDGLSAEPANAEVVDDLLNTEDPESPPVNELTLNPPQLNSTETKGYSGRDLTSPPIHDMIADDLSTKEEAVNSVPETSIKLKFLDDTQKTVPTFMSSTIGDFKREYFADALAAGKVVRLIFRGQLLRDDSRTLESYGLQNECVVHCHVSNTPYAQPTNANASQNSNQPELRQRNVHNAQPQASTTGMAPHASSSPYHVSPETNILARIIVAIMASFSSVNAYFSLLSGFARGFASPLTATQQATHPDAGFLRNTYRRIHNGIFAAYSSWDNVANGLDAAADAAGQRAPQPLCLGDFLMWIFAVQFACIWAFVYFFPQLCDRVAFSLLILLTLYFVFVVCRSRQVTPDASSQQETDTVET